MTNLNALYLAYNQISNIRAISNLTNLRYLYLDLNQISDISAIGNLTNLDSASITTQSVDLGTVDINNYQVTMNIPNVYDINGNLI